jgi:hypothetical protein
VTNALAVAGRRVSRSSASLPHRRKRTSAPPRTVEGKDGAGKKLDGTKLELFEKERRSIERG